MRDREREGRKKIKSRRERESVCDLCWNSFKKMVFSSTEGSSKQRKGISGML